MSNKVNEIQGAIPMALGQLITTASTTITEVMWIVPTEYSYGIRLRRVSVIPLAAMSGTDTNFKSLNVRDGGTDGTGTTAIVTAVAYTSGVDLVAGTAVTFTSASTGSVMPYAMAAGRVLRVGWTNTLTGMTTPACYVQIEYTLDTTS